MPPLRATTLPATPEFAVMLHAAALAGTALVPVNPELPEPVLPDEVPAGTLVVLFTSGSTGEPRPVALTRENFEASARGSADILGVRTDDRWLCCLPVFHVGGLSILVRSALNATTAVLEERFDVQRVKDLLESGEVTVVSLVPTMLARLRDAGLERAHGLRALLLGGGPIPDELFAWAVGVGLPVRLTYGMTETTSQIATAAAGERLAHPLPGVGVRISADGEILVRGEMVAPGAADGDGWLHSGDVGSLDADGRLTVHGRLKDLIVTGGENVAPVEVEQALLAHPGVADAGVLGVPDREWGEAVCALVVPGELGVAPDQLREWCRERLPGFKAPKRIELVDALPRNAAGKLVRDELRTLISTR